jgi:hypothetical protein
MHLFAIPVAATGLSLLIGGHFGDSPTAKMWGIVLLCVAPVIVIGSLGLR